MFLVRGSYTCPVTCGKIKFKGTRGGLFYIFIKITEADIELFIAHNIFALKFLG